MSDTINVLLSSCFIHSRSWIGPPTLVCIETSDLVVVVIVAVEHLCPRRAAAPSSETAGMDFSGSSS